MKTPHTKEPWFAVEYAGFISIQDGPHYENRNLLDCSNWKGEDILDEETIRANGQRIVECVNAMTGIETPAEFPILGLVMENRELKDKIKSMQEDHEKELIELLKYSDKMMVSSSHEGLSWDQAKSYEEKLTQFRNKQQDR